MQILLIGSATAMVVLLIAGLLDTGADGRQCINGVASYYGDELAGRPTASGEVFDPSGLTAAHPSLPFDTTVRVTNLANDKSVVVRINDRGPFVEGRIIDLSAAAARRIGMIQTGTAAVCIEVLDNV